MRLQIAAILLIFPMTLVFSQQEDILKNYNGDFEADLAYWRFFEVPENIGSTCEITNDAISGGKAVKLTWVADDKNVVADRGFDNWTAHVPVVAGTDYTVKAWMKSDTTNGLIVTFTVGFFDTELRVVSQVDKNFMLTNVYTEQGFTVTVPDNAFSSWIAFRVFNSAGKRVAGTLFLDNVRLIGTPLSLRPRVMNTTLPTDDLPVAYVNVTEEPFSAMADGSADATGAFQRAITRVLQAGGGVVFAPAGFYRFDGNLNIPEKVVLRGEWVCPDSVGRISGTILMPYAERGTAEGTPFITMGTGTGIKDLSIWYPDQTISPVTPYPWTIKCSGINTSVINVTLVNPFNGIKIGPEPNAMHYIRNVYGTPLNQGIWLSQVTDIGRIENVRFKPIYWSNSSFTGAPSQEIIVQWLSENPTKGLVMGRSDWQYIYDIALEGYRTGIEIMKYSDLGPNGAMYGVLIEKSNIGIDLLDQSIVGWVISRSDIRVEGNNAAAVHVGDNFNSIVQFNSCTFGGDPLSAIQFSENASGRLTFQNCIFENWGQNGDAPAIDCNRGSVAVLGSVFSLDKLHLRLGKDVYNAQILDNVTPAGLNIENNSTGEVVISQEPLGFSKDTLPPHVFASEPRPDSDSLLVVSDFGALPDGVTDNTVAFQQALDSAGKLGGGTVYIPDGMFRVDGHLTVPHGVELRGIWDVPHHTMSIGSILLAYEGKDDPAAPPFLSLESGSGIRGFTIWYPEQNHTNVHFYPWSIRTLGENCWVKDISVGGTYQCLDMASFPSAGHYVSYLAAAPLRTGIFVDQNNGEGWIENVHFNPHLWAYTDGYPWVVKPDIGVIIDYEQENLEAYKIASAKEEHILGTFVYAARKGFYLAPDDGASKVDVFLHGTDAGGDAIYLASNLGSKVNFHNTQLVLLGNYQSGIITTDPEFKGDANFFNTISWGETGPTALLEGDGRILIQQINTYNGAFKLDKGKIRLDNITISSQAYPQYIIGGEINNLMLFGSYARFGLILNDFISDRSAVEIDYAYKRAGRVVDVVTGFEDHDITNTWDNTFYGHKDFSTTDTLAFRCEAITADSAHTGNRVLQVKGGKINGLTPLYKVFDCWAHVSSSSVLTYWIKPNNVAGKTGYIDILFTDGTLLSAYSPKADDGLPLNGPRGSTDEWNKVSCHLGTYAAGKIIKTILAGAITDTAAIYDFFLDDLLIDGLSSLERLKNNKSSFTLQSYPNPFSDRTTMTFDLNTGGNVSLAVYDMLGRKIVTLLDDVRYTSGRHKVEWQIKQGNGGMYLVRMVFNPDNGGAEVTIKKLIRK